MSSKNEDSYGLSIEQFPPQDGLIAHVDADIHCQHAVLMTGCWRKTVPVQ